MILKRLWRKFGINPFDQLLKRAKKKEKKRFLICWNRGLGDLPLGLYALNLRIREYIPDANITYITRSDLAEGFKLLGGINSVLIAEWKRGESVDLGASLARFDLSKTSFDVILENPDPTYWLRWQLGTLIPKLQWNTADDELSKKYGLSLEKKYIGVHVHTETGACYGYDKNWPLDRWKELFKQVDNLGVHVILFGFDRRMEIEGENIVDLRGKTSLSEMLSVIKNACRYLVLPDSGVLSLVYFLDVDIPIDIVSLWADPRQGVLKQNVSSPNPSLRHLPLIAQEGNLQSISVDEVMSALFGKLKYDQAVLDRQREHVYCPTSFEPYMDHSITGSVKDKERGQQLIREGKVGCLILAGGQGTRLNVDGPKGIVKVSNIKAKSLFQLFAERTKSAADALPLCIMTSPLNDQVTRAFFEENKNFGLTHLDFFQQGMLPFLDDNERWILKDDGKLAEGPDGNGNALRLFYESGLFHKWKELGVEYVQVVLIDNPLADPFDAEFVGFAERNGSDIALKAVERLSPEEKMGFIAEVDGKIKIIEYSEMPANRAKEFTLASPSLFCFSMDFIESSKNVVLPLHRARKKMGTKEIWKCETFIFDLLDVSKKSNVLLYPRNRIYSPLKNAEGEKSLATVQHALLEHDRYIYSALSGLDVSTAVFELDPAFYYPTDELKKRCQGRSIEGLSYINVENL